MSKINDQIKELQTKLKRIEFLNHILDSAKAYENKDYIDVKDDVVLLLEGFVTNTINGIETDAETTSTVTLKGEFSAEDLNIVRNMVNRVKSKTPAKANIQANDPYGPGTSVKKDLVDNNDKLSFALDNRHLANKRVTIANDTGMTVTGEVVGLDAPNVLVKTDTGPTIHVPLGNVSLI